MIKSNIYWNNDFSLSFSNFLAFFNTFLFHCPYYCISPFISHLFMHIVVYPFYVVILHAEQKKNVGILHMLMGSEYKLWQN